MSAKTLSSSTSQRVVYFNIVYLNIGGKTFKTLISTIQKYPDSLIAKILMENQPYGRAAECPVFIDRNPASFEWILDIYRDDDYKETMPRKSEEYLQRELDFYQLPSLDALGLSSKFCVKSFSAEAASKELVQEIVHEIKEKGLENMFPWCVYIYDKVSLDDLKLQRRILVIPDAVRHARPSDLLSYIKEKEHKEFIATALSSKLYLGQKSRCLFRGTDEATFTLQPVDDFVGMLREEARRLGLSVEARQLEILENNTTAKDISFQEAPYISCSLLRK